MGLTPKICIIASFDHRGYKIVQKASKTVLTDQKGLDGSKKVMFRRYVQAMGNKIKRV